MIECFAPLETKACTTLILGSMPSVASLSLGQYYGHARNLFWPILSVLFEEPIDTYVQKCSLLERHGIALWDVLASCERSGSLDSAISHPIPNDIVSFLHEHQDLSLVCFNGKAASTLYRRHVGHYPEHLSFLDLPSTSPANTLPFEQKLLSYSMLVNKERRRS